MSDKELVHYNSTDLTPGFTGVECYVEASHGANGEKTYSGNRTISTIGFRRSAREGNNLLLDIVFEEGDCYTLPNVKSLVPKKLDDDTIEFRSWWGIDYLLIRRL